jgi:hypothetical protein
MSLRKKIDENVVLSGIGLPVLIVLIIIIGIMVWMKVSGF